MVLWRHGRTAWNLAGRVQGTSDIPLDDVGRQQARAAAEQLAMMRPARVLSSDLSRALETAQILGDLIGVEVETDVRFREMHFGAREGLTWHEAWQKFPEGLRAWVEGDETQIPGSETHQQAGERFAEGLREHLETGDDEVVVVVAHGGVLRAGACAFLGFHLAQWHLFGGLNNCSWSVLEESRHEEWARWRITEWNADSLPRPILSDDD
ncbi:MAG: histidine phosphatase family protein [Aeromicrobium sp.]